MFHLFTDNGTGRFSVNFTTAFANGNYSIAGSHNSFNDGANLCWTRWNYVAYYKLK